MLSVAICDDDRLFAEDLRKTVENRFDPSILNLRTFVQAFDMAGAVNDGFCADIVLLDIELGDSNGIELAKSLFPKSSGTQVIFITGHGEYCTDVYEADHIYFLLKPIEKEKLYCALEKAYKNLQVLAGKMLTVNAGGRIMRIPLLSIPYVESRSRKACINFDDGTIEIYSTLSQLIKLLGEEFTCCHKSYLVNMGRVSNMESDHFIMDNGENIPISQKKRAETKRIFLDYIGVKM